VRSLVSPGEVRIDLPIPGGKAFGDRLQMEQLGYITRTMDDKRFGDEFVGLLRKKPPVYTEGSLAGVIDLPETIKQIEQHIEQEKLKKVIPEDSVILTREEHEKLITAAKSSTISYADLDLRRELSTTPLLKDPFDECLLEDTPKNLKK
jgi:hypothetical protein